MALKSYNASSSPTHFLNKCKTQKQEAYFKGRTKQELKEMEERPQQKFNSSFCCRFDVVHSWSKFKTDVKANNQCV